jgi:catechol 2,3-dioxygenase-like lactoylglutathione lyase family enzyme
VIHRLAHVGICVSDLERSLRFYRDGLGFRETGALDLAGEPSATLLELPGVALRARYLERDGARIELLYYPRPGATGGGARPMNALGLTHLSFRVAELDVCLERLVALGGKALAHTRVVNAGLGMQAIFLTDPDGTRIELVAGP